jgi:uncharacterized HhH-GPD family protein
VAMWLSGDADADKLLGESNLALVIGMVLDQQVPFERAFSAPYELQQRLGSKLTAKKLAELDPDVLRELFTRRHALHRFPGSMATRVQSLCQVVVDEWGGKVERVWETAGTGEELYGRLKVLPGFGDYKARVFIALLGKQLGCKPKGWREASTPYGEAGTTMSVADISSKATLDKVRTYKREKRAAAKAAAT